MAILLHGMDLHNQQVVRGLLPPNVPSTIRTIVLVHPLFIGADSTEREARIAKILAAHPVPEELAELEAYVRDEQDLYLAGLQSVLDNPGYTVGVLFESSDTLYRVEKIERLDKTGRPWLLVPTHPQGADPDPNRPATWATTIQDMVNLGIRHVDLGGCYLMVDNGTIVPCEVDYSCVNNVLFELTAPRPKPFQSIGIATSATYIKQLPPPQYRVPRLRRPV